ANGCSPKAAPMWRWKAPGSIGNRSWKELCRSWWLTRKHVKKVPGRKKDTEWLADLLCHGAAPQLRSAQVDPRIAPLDPLPAQTGGEAGSGPQPTVEATGISQYQVGQRGHRYIQSLPAD